MLKVFLTAVVCSVLGWYAHAWYAEHGMPATVRVEIAASDAPKATPSASTPVRAQKPVQTTKAAPKPATWDDGIDYGRTHPAYTTPGIGYYAPPST